MRNVSHILEKQLTDYLVTDQARFYRLAYSYLKNREEALDAVQTAVCRALEKQGELKEPEALRAWFYHILVHVCMDVLRSRKRVTLIPPEALDAGSYEDPLPSDGTLAQRVDALPPEVGIIIKLRFYEDLSLKRAREEYESTPIPEELDARVRAGIRQGRTSSRSRGYKVVRRTAGSVAACLAVLMAGLNVSPTFAAAAADVPVLGGLFQVLTIRDYETVENGIDYKVSVPGVESEGDLAEKVNAEIQERVDAHLAQAQADWDDYKDAFLATGGTEEEWADREMNVLIDYEIKSQTDTTVSFVVDFAEGWVAAMQQRYCYNLDLANDKDITLADVLGEDWVGICNDAVNAKIAADESGLFFTPEQGGFTTVDDATSFYLNEDGSVTLVFPEYSIAAGAAGIVEIPVVA